MVAMDGVLRGNGDGCTGGEYGIVWMRLAACATSSCSGESGGRVQCAGCFDTAYGFAGVDGESV